MKKEIKFYCAKCKLGDTTELIGKKYCFLKNSGNSVAVCTHSPENQPYPELHQMQRGQKGKRVSSASLVLRPFLGSLT